jgi:hypothetical protein
MAISNYNSRTGMSSVLAKPRVRVKLYPPLRQWALALRVLNLPIHVWHARSDCSFPHHFFPYNTWFLTSHVTYDIKGCGIARQEFC